MEDQSSRKRLATATPFVVGCIVLLLLVEVFGFLRPSHPRGFNDFRAFYVSGYLLRSDPASLYNIARQQRVQNALVGRNLAFLPYYHPAYEALLFAPLSLFSFPIAEDLFTGLMVLCLAASFFALRSLFSQPVPWLQVSPGIALLCFVPTVASIFGGQDSVLFLLLLCLAIRALGRDQDAMAGCLFGLALFRFQLSLPLALLLALVRPWRFFAGFVSTAAVVLAVCVGLTGIRGFVSWIHVLAHAGLLTHQDRATQQATQVHPVVMSNLAGLLYAMGTRSLSAKAAFAVVSFASLCIFVRTAIRIRGEKDKDVVLAMALVCTVLISYHFLPYDLGILLPAFFRLVKHIRVAVIFTLYWLPLALYLCLGARSSFLYAVPLLALLMYLDWTSPHTCATPNRDAVR